MSSKEEWEALKDEFIEKIEKIDRETKWSETEPDWWLEMSNIERQLLNSKFKKN